MSKDASEDSLHDSRPPSAERRVHPVTGPVPPFEGARRCGDCRNYQSDRERGKCVLVWRSPPDNPFPRRPDVWKACTDYQQ
jgi:hypothetical protein